MLYLGRQNRAIFARHTADFCQAILLADKIGRFCRSSDIPFTLPVLGTGYPAAITRVP